MYILVQVRGWLSCFKNTESNETTTLLLIPDEGRRLGTSNFAFIYYGHLKISRYCKNLPLKFRLKDLFH